MDIPESITKMATPEASFPRANGFGLEDSGYLSNTPGSAELQGSNAKIGTRLDRDDFNIPGWTRFSFLGHDTTSVRTNLTNSALYTPDIINGARKKRFAKCSFKKYKSFPVSAFDNQDEDTQQTHDGWPVDEDDLAMAVDLIDDPNRDNFSMYETRNTVNDDSMDVGDYLDSLELAAEDELYNDSVIEKVHSQNKSIGVNSEDGMQLLHSKLTAVQLATQQEPDLPLPSWRNHYGHNGYATISDNMCGKRKIDFFSLLAVESEHTHIVGKILGYLSPQDLDAIVKTCDDYTTVVKTNAQASRRHSKYLAAQAQEKENIQKAKQRPVHSGSAALSEIANLMGAATLSKPARSPPITPNKRRSQSFVRAAQNVKPGEQLTECPLCRQPATVDLATLGGTCIGQFCGHEFCAACRRAMHLNSPCLVLDSPQAKRIRMAPRIGSKQSRRNLQRL